MPSQRKSIAGDTQAFSSRLLSWYDVHKRDLPWRCDRDPYRIWVSEIMLQQTRVAAVVDYYQRFLKKFPTVHKLARARESSVLAAWSGLGYYRRARMLHAAVKSVAKSHAGQIPRSSADLRELPGIGRYTSAAIASIAFGESVAVVDGNVERVLSRISGKALSGEPAWSAANNLLDPSRPGDFNQAMMELGATLCLPRQPKCLFCPVADVCSTKGENKKANHGRRRKREVHYALQCREGSVFLVQRKNDASLMPGMWELPEIRDPRNREPSLTLRHSITVTDFVVRVHRHPMPARRDGRWVSRVRLHKLALTGLTRKILRAAELLLPEVA
jgi:A/G-specific adenine glycosylase